MRGAGPFAVDITVQGQLWLWRRVLSFKHLAVDGSCGVVRDRGDTKTEEPGRTRQAKEILSQYVGPQRVPQTLSGVRAQTQTLAVNSLGGKTTRLATILLQVVHELKEAAVLYRKMRPRHPRALRQRHKTLFESK